MSEVIEISNEIITLTNLSGVENYRIRLFEGTEIANGLCDGRMKEGCRKKLIHHPGHQQGIQKTTLT
jgi:hypothetical protein